MHTMASQVLDLHDSSANQKSFNAQMMKMLEKILDNQNVLRQELFILRTNASQTASSKTSEPENNKNINDNKSISVASTGINTEEDPQRVILNIDKHP